MISTLEGQIQSLKEDLLSTADDKMVANIKDHVNSRYEFEFARTKQRQAEKFLRLAQDKEDLPSDSSPIDKNR